MKLTYPEYKHVPPIEVELIVIANLIIIPSDTTVMAYDSFKYKIMQVSITIIMHDIFCILMLIELLIYL